MCFPPWGTNTLLVPIPGQNKVDELDMVAKVVVRTWGEGLTEPTAVAASVDHIAVALGGYCYYSRCEQVAILSVVTGVCCEL